ncbi:DUF494 family protein [candidate division KSB1 bacterium]|nr:DUF494 family protein [candidate division KSB1 bacterium]
MNERVMEIIVYIVNEMRTNQLWEDSKQFKLLSQKLEDNGYSPGEISFAFSWVLEKVNAELSSEQQEVEPPQTHRMLHDFEKLAISTNAYGYLIQLRELGLIDEMEMEQVIEKALLSENNPVTAHEMKQIVSQTLFKSDDVTEGSFFLLDNSYNVH